MTPRGYKPCSHHVHEKGARALRRNSTSPLYRWRVQRPLQFSLARLYTKSATSFKDASVSGWVTPHFVYSTTLEQSTAKPGIPASLGLLAPYFKSRIIFS